ncbi:MAG TPA: rod shape-determining protein [Candidatus Ratteibacteria bacterium]|jgi:rod shape-determining protein MreB|uniref:Cell shape-determining protein MreB n=1 Tax=candidate division TA06 bacterium ADurb.Bin131 TaxID=1852827 RepID=A0A1V6C4U9_UNCT6|nr:MAG: Rod shape-determining protein MreB [candidate division TA06 bacterium ADurb.Bin131]HOC02033.1 rod shape-determining protein [bacterium]HON05448.1 rod shape-determining protein [bacterium]HRS05818.1 rod shape-determining protein [Candidatus Ratteibacteria bacterium]HRV03802.1 rod shape-determining protein [Candidatus Ratteibacteria bacterium]
MVKLFRLLSNDLGIDLGTANTAVYLRGKGVVLMEPSIVAINHNTKQVLAVGTEAKKMLGKTPANIIAMKPMKDGVIADFDACEAMLRYFINRVRSPRHKFVMPPRMVIAVPSGITSVERRAVRETALKAGARIVRLVEEPMASAIGVGLPVEEPCGSFILDIGGGTTEMAVISLGGLVLTKSLRIAGNEMDEAISNYLKKKYNLLIGEKTAEDIKIQIGSAFPLEEELTIEVHGRDLVEGLPKMIKVRSEEIRDALRDTLMAIVSAVRDILEETPPELSSDLVENGLVIAGGGALLRNIDKLISQETKLPVVIAENPLLAVVTGAGKMLDEERYFKMFPSE